MSEKKENHAAKGALLHFNKLRPSDAEKHAIRITMEKLKSEAPYNSTVTLSLDKMDDDQCKGTININSSVGTFIAHEKKP